MTFLATNGFTVQFENFRMYPQDIGHWEDLPSTWDDWYTWFTNPNPQLNILMPEPLDLGQVETFNITSSFQGVGIVDFYFYYSDTFPMLDSLGNYQTLHVTANQQNIPSITARYVWMAVSITKQGSDIIQYFDNLSVSATTTEKSLSYTDINSSTLSGTADNRLFSIPIPVGGIKSVQVSSQGTTSNYNVDMYVSNIPTSSKTYPRILDKSTSGVNLQFVGIDGKSYDSTFDIKITVTPEWYCDYFGNLQER